MSRRRQQDERREDTDRPGQPDEDRNPHASLPPGDRTARHIRVNPSHSPCTSATRQMIRSAQDRHLFAASRGLPKDRLRGFAERSTVGPYVASPPLLASRLTVKRWLSAGLAACLAALAVGPQATSAPPQVRNGRLAMSPPSLPTAARVTTDFTVWTVRPDGRGRREIAKGDHPKFSRDGKRLVYETRLGAGSASAGPETARADGSQRRRLTQEPDYFPAWSRAGELLSFVRGGGVWTMRSDGSDAHLLAGSPAWTAGAPAWSPDGRWLAFTRTDSATSQRWVTVVHPDGTGLRDIIRGEDPTWSRLGRLAFLRSGTLYVIARSGRVRRIARDVGGYDWSPSGRRLAYGRRGQLYVAPERGGKSVRLTKRPGPAPHAGRPVAGGSPSTRYEKATPWKLRCSHLHHFGRTAGRSSESRTARCAKTTSAATTSRASPTGRQ